MIARRLMEREEMVESVMGRSGSWRSFGLVGEFVVFLWGGGWWMLFARGFRFRFKLSLDQFLSFVDIFFFFDLIIGGN